MECSPRFHPTQDQLALAAQITDSLDRLLPLSRLHQRHVESDETWQALEALGIFGATLSEEFGGSGLGVTEEALIMIGLGRQLIGPGVVATVGAARAPNLDSRVAEIVAGRAAAAYQRRDRPVIIEEPGAKFLMIRTAGGAVLAEAGGKAERINDKLWLADMRRLTCEPRPLSEFHGRALLRLRLIDAAVMVGISEAAIAMAVAYAGIREQFGHAIGGFQAVKHHCANMVVAARRARDQVSFAAVALDTDRRDAHLQVECAVLTAATASLENAALNIQIHGGIGFSDEADPHLVLKRAQIFVTLSGGLEAATERIAAVEPFL